MPWVKVDDHFDEHPKHAQVSPLGWGVWLKGLAYCNRNTTDGFIPRSVAHSMSDFEVIDDDRVFRLGVSCGLSGDDITSEWIARLLVNAGLWEAVPGGYLVHDYADYQPSKAEVEAGRAKNTERVQRWRNAQRNGVTNDEVTGAPVPDPVPESSSSLHDSHSAELSPVDDERLWKLVAERKLSRQPAGAIKQPQPWLRKTARNAQSELAERARELFATFDVSIERLADVLVDGGVVPQSWQHDRRAS